MAEYPDARTTPARQGQFAVLPLAHESAANPIHGESAERRQQMLPVDRLPRLAGSHAERVDDGWKDTVLVVPGEKVRILRRFEDYSGLFLRHCHNLEHEDMGMMRNFRVE